MPFTFLGLWRSLTWPQRVGEGAAASTWRPWQAGIADHRVRVQWLIVALPAGVLIVHSALFWLGKMASNGELRYLLVVAPMWGLLSAAGWEWVWTRLKWHRPLVWAGLAVLVPPVIANLTYTVVPIQADLKLRQAQAAARWYEQHPLRAQYPRVTICNPFVRYYLDVSQTDPHRAVAFGLRSVAQAPPGTLMIWDEVYGPYNSDADLVVRLADIVAAGWVVDGSLEATLSHLKDPSDTRTASGVKWRAFLSPRTIMGRPTTSVAEQPATQPDAGSAEVGGATTR
jgi:hypothetical protein